MPYITVRQPPIYYQFSLDELLFGDINISKISTPNITNTRTGFRRNLPAAFLAKYNFDEMINCLEQFNEQHKALFETERKKLYYTFHIPKKSGGLREINAPEPELSNALYQLKGIFENVFGVLYHTTAFAYVKGRCTVDALKRHQQNESKWFAKYDFSDFFGSTTEEFVLNMFGQIFPFSQIMLTDRGYFALKKALSLCFLNGGLPQGTPISPLITNVMMIPIDHQISNDLRHTDSRYVYTRYADDIQISSKVGFDHLKVEEYIVDVLSRFNAPFSIKKKKTHYGSSSGKNWNLGLMLNKDNEITIGWKKKRTFKAMVNNYIVDHKNDVRWELHDVQILAGQLSYFRSIETDYINHIIDEYNAKYSVDFEKLLKDDLSE